MNLSPTMAHEISPKEEKFWKKEKDFALINDEKPYDISSIGSGTDYV